MKTERDEDAGCSDTDGHDAWQALMDRCYGTWPAEKVKGWNGEEYERQVSYEDFISSLSERDAMGVVLGNLNYQVQNGGFVQWHDNGYSDCIDTVIAALEAVGTPTAKQVLSLVHQAEDALNFQAGAKDEFAKVSRAYDIDYLGDLQHNFDDMVDDLAYRDLRPLDTQYYELDDQLQEDVEAWVKGQRKDDVTPG